DLKKRFARANQVYKADDRIRLIAMDLATHFDSNIDSGLKGMLACDSKLSAIRYKQYLDEVGLFESAIVMSPPDTREGHTEVDERKQPEIQTWWKDNVGSQSEDARLCSRLNRPVPCPDPAGTPQNPQSG
ncbi:type I restriction endonuclease subunit R, partial [Acetobacter indonesiensis]